MAQIKYEALEEGVDELNTSMQSLIEQADWFLNNISNRSSNNSSTYDESVASTSRYSISSPNNTEQQEGGSEPRTGAQIVDNSSTSSTSIQDDGNGSSDSERTILCRTPELLNPAAAMPVRSYGQDVIVIDTPTPTERRRVPRRASLSNVSIIDLTANPNPENPAPAPIITISSDEESEEPATTSGNYSSITINRLAVSVQTSTPLSIEIISNPRRHRRRQRDGRLAAANNHYHSVEDISMREPISSVHRPLPPQPQRQRNDVSAQIATSGGTSANRNIICPICYDTLANKPSICTPCGHVFCADCIKLSLRTAKKCPLCNKKLSNSKQMHPIYFSTE